LKTALETLTKVLIEGKFPILLIGGYALQAHGVVRQTLDVDCLIAESSSKNLENILSKLGYRVKARTSNFIRFTHSSAFLEDVDVLLVDESTFDEMIKMSSNFVSGVVQWRVPCLSHLIALKLHAVKNNPDRELRDLADIITVLKNNPGSLSKSEINNLCLKYGPEGIYSKLEKALQ